MVISMVFGNVLFHPDSTVICLPICSQVASLKSIHCSVCVLCLPRAQHLQLKFALSRAVMIIICPVMHGSVKL